MRSGRLRGGRFGRMESPSHSTPFLPPDTEADQGFHLIHPAGPPSIAVPHLPLHIRPEDESTGVTQPPQLPNRTPRNAELALKMQAKTGSALGKQWGWGWAWRPEYGHGVTCYVARSV